MSKLIICIDGLGKDLISKKNTPFLYDFGRKNTISEFETLFAFTGLEYCFFTGKNPRESEIWLEFCFSKRSIFDNSFLRFLSFNKKLRDYFGVLIQLSNKRTWVSGLHNIPKEKLRHFETSLKDNLWTLDFFKNKNFSFYKWPFHAIRNKDKNSAKIIFKYENDDERLTRLLSLDNMDVYYTQLMLVDKTIHKFGKNSKKTRDALKKMDKIIEKHVNNFLNKYYKSDVYIWSDHGFSDIKNYIDLTKLLPKTKGYLCFIAGTTVHFWFNNKRAENLIKNKLKHIEHVRILKENDYIKYKIPNSRKYGDLIAYVEKENYFFPNFYQKSINEKFVSMHGYPDNRELNGFLISNKNFPKKLRIENFMKYC